MKGRICIAAAGAVAMVAGAPVVAGTASGATKARTDTAHVALGSAGVRKVDRLLAEIDPGRVERYDRKLVSFGTRNTMSAQDDPNRGIGAARDWIYSEFQRISQECGGCLTVEKQTFTTPANPPPRGRFPEATVLTNVYAALKGTTDATRVYVVSGHYDSMCTSPTDAKCDAPGANDDASGSAVSIELARVMSKRKFDGTIVFMTVPGEEQGLTGSTYYAEQAK